MFKNGTRMADYRLYSQNWNFVSKSGPWDHFFGFFSDGHFLGTEAITRIDFWIFFPKFMILNKNKNWKNGIRLRIFQKFPSIRIRNQKIWKQKSGNLFCQVVWKCSYITSEPFPVVSVLSVLSLFESIFKNETV